MEVFYVVISEDGPHTLSKEWKKSCKENGKLSHVINGEHCPGQWNQNQHIKMTHDRKPIQIFSDKKFFYYNDKKENQSPQYKIVSGTVPDACHGPYNQQISNGNNSTFSVSAQWDVNIFPKPGAKSNMPSAPKFSHRAA